MIGTIATTMCSRAHGLPRGAQLLEGHRRQEAKSAVSFSDSREVAHGAFAFPWRVGSRVRWRSEGDASCFYSRRLPPGWCTRRVRSA